MTSQIARHKAGALAVGLLVIVALYLWRIRFDPQEPGMNNTAAVLDAFIDGHPIRNNDVLASMLEILPQIPTRANGARPVVWLGNSHQHAVNNKKPGETVSSVYLHRELNGDRWPGATPVYGLSFPNLTFQEQFLLTVALVSRPEVERPRVIVSGVRFHDAREMGIRVALRPLLKLDWVRDTLSSPGWRPEHREAYELLKETVRAADDEEAAAVETGVDPWLSRNVGQFIPIFSQREYIYATTLYEIHIARDRLFHISTRTKREILEPRYVAAVEYLDAAALIAKEHGVEMLLYNVPLRQEVDNPYVPAQYTRFRRDLAEIANRRGIVFRDYDDLIPRELWGTWYTSDFPDFSHFTAAGHKLLAARVADDIKPLLGTGREAPGEAP